MSFPDPAAIRREAGDWIARLDRGPLSPDDADALRLWTAQSPAHFRTLVDFARLWDDMAALEALADIFPLAVSENGADAEADAETETGAEIGAASASAAGSTALRAAEDAGASSREESAFARLRFPAVAAGVAVLAFAAAAVFVSFGMDGSGQLPTTAGQRAAPLAFATVVGETSAHLLGDGTEIVLNTDSRVEVDYAGARRVVRLLKGEAGFDVAPDAARPFVVFAGDGRTEAIGTAFNVRLRGRAVDVTVTEGKVRVVSDAATGPGSSSRGLSDEATPAPLETQEASVEESESLAAENTNARAPRELVLSAGEAAEYGVAAGASSAPLAEAELARKLAWRRGALIFDGQTLEEAIAEVSRYTAADLVIADPSIAGMRVGGHYKTDDIEALLAALSAGFDIRVEKLSDGVIRLSAR